MSQDLVSIYGRSEKGKRLFSDKPSSPGKRTTIISGLNLSGMIGSFIFQGFLNKNIFEFYLEKILLPELEPGTIIIMDNYRPHKGESIENLVSSFGCHIKYLPRYSPELNPIEYSWSKIKNYLRSKVPRTLLEVENSLIEGLKIISTQDSINYIRHCGYSVSKSI